MRPMGRMTIRGQAAPQPLPSAGLISKAEDVAVRHALMRAIEAVQAVGTTERDDRYRYTYSATPRNPVNVKQDSLAALRRLRDEGVDQ